jgi:hypothetical protein
MLQPLIPKKSCHAYYIVVRLFTLTTNFFDLVGFQKIISCILHCCKIIYTNNKILWFSGFRGPYSGGDLWQLKYH